MKQIPLSQGKVALVDDEDFDLLSQLKWYAAKGHGTFYVQCVMRVAGKNVTLKMHRLILGLTDPKVFCDHIDGDGLNNQRSNLRECTNSQNRMNSKSRTGTLSRFKGVTLNREGKASPWKAQIRHQNKRKCLGYYATQEEAALAYNAKAIEMFGEFAKLNVV